MKNMTLIEWMVVFAIICIVLGGPVGWVARSHFEAKAYNKLTGGNATTWDAMWVQLRVEGKE